MARAVLVYFSAIAALLGAIQLFRDLDFLTVVLGTVGAVAWVGSQEAHRTHRDKTFLLLLLTSIAAGLFALIHVQPEDDPDGRSPKRLMEVGEVPTEGRPLAIAAAQKRYVWVAGVNNAETSGTLARIDSHHLSFRAEPIESFEATYPYDIAVGEKAIWVTDGGALIKLDLRGRQIWRHEIVDGGENEVDVGLGLVWFKQTSPGRLIGLTLGSGKPVVEVPLETEATALAVGRGAVWVSARYNAPAAVLKINRKGEIEKTIEVPAGPLDLADGEDSVAIAHEGNFVTRIDPRLGGGALLPGDSELNHAQLPGGVATEERTVWVAMTDSDKVFALDECDGRVLGWVDTNVSPSDVAVLDGEAYVPNSGSGDVSVFKLRQPVEKCA